MNHQRALLLTLAAALSTGHHAAAQAFAPADGRELSIRFEPSVWFVAPSARIRLPGSPSGIDTTRIDAFNLDSPRPSPSGEIIIDSGRWSFSTSASIFQTQDRGFNADRSGFLGAVPFAAGDRLRSSFGYVTAEATVGRRLDLPPSIQGKPGDDLRTTIEVLGGLRAHHYDFRFQNDAGATAATRQLFVEPLLGFKGSVDIYRDFTIDLRLTLSGLPSSDNRSIFGVDILSGFQWRPTPNFGIQVGYRLLSSRAQRGEGDQQFKWSGSMAGVYAGITLRF